MPRPFPLRAAMSKTLCRAARSSVAACGYAATIALGWWWWLVVGWWSVVRGRHEWRVVSNERLRFYEPPTTNHEPASARRRGGRGLDVRRDREHEIRVIGLPRFHRHVDNGAAALFEDDTARRL